MNEIKSKNRTYSMEALFEVVGKSRQGLRKADSRNKQLVDQTESLLTLVKAWRKHHPGMSARQLHYSMSNKNIIIPIGINKFEKLLSEQGLNVAPTYRQIPRTSDGKGLGHYSNLTNNLVLTAINQLIVADITYFRVNSTWCYLFLLKDAYSQRVLSLVPSRNMEYINAMKCLDQAIALRGDNAMANCIHHSDNGSQYNAKVYKQRLQSLNILISRASQCKENGSAEHINHVVKNMYLSHWEINTFEALEKKCELFVQLNNNERAIEQLGNVSPIEFESIISKLPLNQRPKFTMHDFTKDKT